MAIRRYAKDGTVYPLADPPPQILAAAKVYSYEPLTGVFTVKDDAPNVKPCRRGKPARVSLDCKGYQRLTVSHQGRRDSVSAQRLAWYLMKGEYPECLLDHSNGDRSDNRWENLRIASYRQNAFNRAGANGKELAKGVYQSSDGYTWRARIKVEGRMVHLGTYATEGEAIAAYQGAAVVIQGKYRRAA